MYASVKFEMSECYMFEMVVVGFWIASYDYVNLPLLVSLGKKFLPFCEGGSRPEYRLGDHH